MIEKAIKNAVNTLASAGIETAQLDAEVLLSHVLKCERIDLYINKERNLSSKEKSLFFTFIKRRAKREPVAYITGLREFWSLRLKITPDVLIPRPETEGVVEIAIDALYSAQRHKGILHQATGLNILDICTGSGCIAAALATEFPGAKITVTDISQRAIEIAKINLSFASERTKFLTGDLFHAFKITGAEHSDSQKFDLITANPPYVSESDYDKLEPEIAKYEPKIALKGGSDGLAFSIRILNDAPRFLKKDGLLVMEVGVNQASVLIDETRKKRLYKKIYTKKDYAGIDRYIVAKK